MKLFVITSIEEKSGRTSECAPFYAQDAAAARAEYSRLYSFGKIFGIRQADPLERATHYVDNANARRVSCAYGDGALREISGAFGADSLEAKAYTAYLRELTTAKT